jgi:hypothetical protein
VIHTVSIFRAECLRPCRESNSGIQFLPVTLLAELSRHYAGTVFIISNLNISFTFKQVCEWIAYCSSARWYMSLESHGGMILTGKTEELRKKLVPVAILSATSPTWTTHKFATDCVILFDIIASKHDRSDATCLINIRPAFYIQQRNKWPRLSSLHENRILFRTSWRVTSSR